MSVGPKPTLSSINQNNYAITNKPDSVTPYGPGVVIIYLGCSSRGTSICQPTNIGRAVLDRSPIWHFSTQGLPLCKVTSVHRRLLPYFFTLTIPKYGGYFLWHCLYPAVTGSHSLSGALPYTVRTFLRCISLHNGDNLVFCSPNKNNKFCK